MIKRRHGQQMLRLTQKHVSDIRELQEDFHRGLDEEYCARAQLPLKRLLHGMMTPQVKTVLASLQNESNTDDQVLVEKLTKMLESGSPGNAAGGTQVPPNTISLNDLNDEYWREYRWMRTTQRSELEGLRLHQLRELIPFYNGLAVLKPNLSASPANTTLALAADQNSAHMYDLLVRLSNQTPGAPITVPPTPASSQPLHSVPPRQDPRPANPRDPRRHSN